MGSTKSAPALGGTRARTVTWWIVSSKRARAFLSALTMGPVTQRLDSVPAKQNISVKHASISAAPRMEQRHATSEAIATFALATVFATLAGQVKVVKLEIVPTNATGEACVTQQQGNVSAISSTGAMLASSASVSMQIAHAPTKGRA